MISALDLTKSDDINRLKQFSQVDHPSTFRYFKNRIFEEAIKSHKLTVLYQREGKDVGYAHIDIDRVSGRAYFGICVMPTYQSLGIGKLLTQYILQQYTDTIFLTVDNANTPAINLYKQNGFVLVESFDTHGLWCRL
jgi:ribosomal protein S18 acetylase RimI-like enzyme